MAHRCHAIGCGAAVKPEMLMCRRHWFTVPKVLRDRVWATYRDGQCDDMSPSGSYCDAAKAAVLAVAKRLGIAVTGDEPELTMYDRFKESATDEH